MCIVTTMQCCICALLQMLSVTSVDCYNYAVLHMCIVTTSQYPYQNVISWLLRFVVIINKCPSIRKIIPTFLISNTGKWAAKAASADNMQSLTRDHVGIRRPVGVPSSHSSLWVQLRLLTSSCFCLHHSVKHLKYESLFIKLNYEAFFLISIHLKQIYTILVRSFWGLCSRFAIITFDEFQIGYWHICKFDTRKLNTTPTESHSAPVTATNRHRSLIFIAHIHQHIDDCFEKLIWKAFTLPLV